MKDVMRELAKKNLKTMEKFHPEKVMVIKLSLDGKKEDEPEDDDGDESDPEDTEPDEEDED